MADLRGQQLGNYHLQQLIGRGGFADVYLGEHIHLHTPAAIKVLQNRLGSNETQSFYNEARTIANLEHPNIIRIMDFGIEPDTNTPFIVMYYAAQGSLRQRHPKGSILPLDLVVSYTNQVASALQYAHAQKLIHRDIKPENMLLGRNNEVLLSDFGIAQTAQSSQYQHTGTIVGTAAYMAPEQLQGKPSRASDQYSLGIVIYEWLSGSYPFQGSFVELYSQHLNVTPPSLLTQQPTLPADVDQVVQRALAKDPRQRFNTVQEFAQALEQASTATQVRSGDSTTWRKDQPLPLPGTGQPSAQIPALSSDALSQSTIQPPAPGISGQFPGASSTAAPFPTNQPTPAPARSSSFPIPPAPPAAGQAPTWQAPMPPYTQPQWTPQPAPQRPPSKPLRTIGIIIGVLVIIALVVNILSHVVPSGSDQSAGTSIFQNNSSSSNTNTNTDAHTPAAPAPKPGTILYQADWSRDFNGWNGAAEWKASGNGTLGSDGSGNGNGANGFIIFAPANVTGSNYAIEAEIQFVRSTYQAVTNYSYIGNPDEFGILVRGDGNSNGYEVGVQDEDTNYFMNSLLHPKFTQGTMTLVAKVQGDNLNSASSYLIGLTNDSETLTYQSYQPDTQQHLFRVEVFGNTINLYIDKHLYVTTTDNQYTSGRVGLRSVYADINVSNFKVIACSATSC